MDRLPLIDLAVLIGYLAVTVGLGCWFATRKLGTDEFMAGGRSMPGWAVGLSMFGSYISSISFLANPGKSFAGNWNAFVFTLATPLAALIAVRWFVPFYRRNGNVSAYEHLEHRFGPWARTYAVVCFLLTQVARTGTIVYLLALAVAPLVGGQNPPTWLVPAIIIATGAIMVLYTVFGGVEAAVWIGVIQSIVLVVGPFICIIVLLIKIPGGAPAVMHAAAQSHKFSLGSFGASISQSTFWVVMLYGLVMNLNNFGVDQSYVQRYIATPTDREAKKSVLMTAALYVPVAGFFFFIGTALFALHAARPELFGASLDVKGQPDRVFPFFIAHMLPVGMSGLVIAAIFAASMDSSLSSMATLTLCDLYKRYLRPNAGETESMRVLHLSTIGWGIIGTCIALAMMRVSSVLDTWWEMAGILSGGMLGLFLLGMISRAKNAAAVTGIILGVAVILWMTFSPRPYWPNALSAWRSPFHSSLIIVVGTMVVLLVGLLVGRLSGGAAEAPPGVAPTVRPTSGGIPIR